MNKSLDPLPYQCLEGARGRDSVPALCNFFNPRMGYSQDEADY